MNEVYRKQSMHYVSGKFYGAENGHFTKILLLVTLNCVAGKYQDILMTRVVNSKKLEVWGVEQGCTYCHRH